MSSLIHARAVVPGQTEAEVLYSHEPISFWGGYDQYSGKIIDQRHPLCGKLAAGKILVLPFSRGSSTTTAILLEAIQLGTAPAALISLGTDAFFALASIVADELYHKSIPVLAIQPQEASLLETAHHARIWMDGLIEILINKTIRG